MAKNNNDSDGGYEYRVWGEHRKARKVLAAIGTGKSSEEIKDCYFLVDDSDWNAKVRDSTLKVKRLVAEKRGFEQWSAEWHRDGDAIPAPFDQLFDDLHLDRLNRGKSFSISKAVKGLDDDHETKPVFVTKNRVRYRVGSIRAEVTDIQIDASGEVLQTLAIVGDDLDELVALRKKLGLTDAENVAVHVAIDPDTDTDS